MEIQGHVFLKSSYFEMNCLHSWREENCYSRSGHKAETVSHIVFHVYTTAVSLTKTFGEKKGNYWFNNLNICDVRPDNMSILYQVTLLAS